ncbi:MAG TPA: K(+)-transporting ATPase subunit C [Gaiellaceae bacterium]|nr:K(+)-transporting ATPase subunit C [Gaiellaceae bacterium]
MRRQILPALLAFLCLTVLTGIVYPLVVTGVSQIVFPNRSNGSLIERDGKVVGSKLIGQNFTGPRYFHSRPSAAGDGYDAMSSSASNLGPTNQTLISDVRKRVLVYDAFFRHPGAVPGDAVTASGSGLDPHISPANARLQAPRIARARGLPLDTVLDLVDKHTDGRSLGFLGEPGVNVLELNLALDRA